MSLSRIAMAAAIVIGFSIVAAAKPATLATDTNLRKAPGTTSEVITLIPKGASIEVGACDAGWCQVNWNGQDGYAIARNLGEARAVAPRRTVRRAPPRTADYDDDDDEDEVYYGPGYGPGYGGGYVVAPAPYGYGYHFGYRPYFYGGWRRW